MNVRFHLRTLLIVAIFLVMTHSPLPSWAGTVPPIPVTQGEAVTLTLKLKNIGAVTLKGVTVQGEAETIPDWVVAQAVETAVDVPVADQPFALVPFRFTVDKHAPLGVSQELTLRISDADGAVWRQRFALEVQPRPTPKAFRLLQNYPNPFNPETWIPYELKEAAEVQLRIYEPSGRLVRTLDLGFKEADWYTAREKAAYWDGRNDAGERVASGLYFYHLQAGSFSAIRKLLILK